MSHVFLSYSHKDQDLMYRIRDTLSNAGFEIFTDEQLLPGIESWRDTLEAAIEAAGAIVVILSEDAKKSKSIEEELAFASHLGVQIFPILGRGDERKAIPMEVVRMQRVDIRTDYDRAMARLVKGLKAHIRTEEPEKRALEHKDPKHAKRLKFWTQLLELNRQRGNEFFSKRAPTNWHYIAVGAQDGGDLCLQHRSALDKHRTLHRQG